MFSHRVRVRISHRGLVIGLVIGLAIGLAIGLGLVNNVQIFFFFFQKSMNCSFSTKNL